MVIPTGSRQVELISNIPIAENIIVGEVPQTFADISEKDGFLNLVP
jgi:hypothetical protein